jgi:carbonic anhydrase
MQQELTNLEALNLLKEGNKRFVSNLKYNRNLLQQVNETRDGQHPFAVIISCMDSRTSAELVFDQGLGDIFSIRIAGNVINDEILGSTEFGCKVVGAKVVLVLGHSSCGAIKGAIQNVELGHLSSVTSKIRRCITNMDDKHKHCSENDMMNLVTTRNVYQSMRDIKARSLILSEMEAKKEIIIAGAIYDVSTGVVEFLNDPVKL